MVAVWTRPRKEAEKNEEQRSNIKQTEGIFRICRAEKGGAKHQRVSHEGMSSGINTKKKKKKKKKITIHIYKRTSARFGMDPKRKAHRRQRGAGRGKMTGRKERDDGGSEGNRDVGLKKPCEESARLAD